MGNENRRSDFDQENWETLARIGVKTVLKNRMTCSLLDLYECDEPADHPSSQRAEQIFLWRKGRGTQEHVPLVFHYEIQRNLLGSSQKQRVFTEHLTRVSELPPFSKQEAFLLLEHILEVLPLLYRQVGLFHANVYTVGVNDSGRTKVWVNENFAKNHPQEDDVIRKPSKNLELAIVNNLVRMLKAKVYNNEIKPEYPFSLNFLETARYIKETRQKYPEYEIAKVYLNRNEFNEVYKAALTQKIEQNYVAPVSMKQEQVDVPFSSRKKGTSPRKLLTEVTKTEPSETTLQYYPPQAYSSPNQPLNRQNNQPVFYYPPNAMPLGRMPVPLYNPPPNQLPLRNAQIPMIPVQSQNKTIQAPRQVKERKLQQSYYLNPPSSPLSPFQTQPNRMPSPTKVDRKTLSPSKFLKKVSMESPKSFSPTKQSTLPQNRHASPSNRAISLSPTKKRDIRPAVEQKKPIDVRPISANKVMLGRQLSRIVQQQQTKYDSFYMRSPEKTQQGFNVELVESIYVKSSDTEEGL